MSKKNRGEHSSVKLVDEVSYLKVDSIPDSQEELTRVTGNEIDDLSVIENSTITPIETNDVNHNEGKPITDGVTIELEDENSVPVKNTDVDVVENDYLPTDTIQVITEIETAPKNARELKAEAIEAFRVYVQTNTNNKLGVLPSRLFECCSTFKGSVNDLKSAKDSFIILGDIVDKLVVGIISEKVSTKEVLTLIDYAVDAYGVYNDGKPNRLGLSEVNYGLANGTPEQMNRIPTLFSVARSYITGLEKDMIDLAKAADYLNIGKASSEYIEFYKNKE